AGVGRSRCLRWARSPGSRRFAGSRGFAARSRDAQPRGPALTDTAARARWIAPGLVIAILAGTAVTLPALGFDVSRAARALVSGSFGSWYAFGSGTLVRATPLILTGLAVALAFQSGVFNIGAEGQFLTGAAAASAIALAGSRAP